MNKRNHFHAFLAALAVTALPAAPGFADETAGNEAGPGYTESKSGVRFLTEAQIAGTAVPLRGVHLYEYYSFDVYSIAFYCPPGPQGAEQVLSENTPRQLVIHYHRKIEAEDIAKATEKTLKDIPDVDIAALRDRLDKVYDCYRTVQEEDRYTISYHPDEGTRIYWNDQLDCTIDGADFAEAFFAIWVDPHGIDDDMSEELRAVD